MDVQVDHNTTLHDADALRALAGLAYQLFVWLSEKSPTYDRLVALELAERGPSCETSRDTSQRYSITPRGRALVEHLLAVKLPEQETKWVIK